MSPHHQEGRKEGLETKGLVSHSMGALLLLLSLLLGKSNSSFKKVKVLHIYRNVTTLHGIGHLVVGMLSLSREKIGFLGVKVFPGSLKMIWME